MTNIEKPKERNLFLAKQVNQDSINDLTKKIIEINEHDKYLKNLFKIDDMKYDPKPIKIYIDSYGGHVYQCLGLLNIMDSSKTPIHTIVTGCAMSCGFIIAICGHKRFGYKRSTYLYHQVSGGAIGKVKDMEEDLVETKRLQEEIEEITIEKTKISKKKLNKVYKQKLDWYITSKEAIDLNIIDEVIK